MRHRKDAGTAPLHDPTLDDIGAPIEVRRHPGARRLTLRVSRTRRTVIVTMPSSCDLYEAGAFLSRNIDWVRERLGSLPEPVGLDDGALLPLRGEPHQVMFATSRGSHGPVSRSEATDGTPCIVVHGHAEHAPRRLFDWLIAEARRDLEARVADHAAKLGVKPRRIAVRDQSSRWGSCSTTGTLSFSWRLVLAPPLILDYVAAHEVAHLAEMNHGARFWALVERTMPRMDEARRWLNVYGIELHRYGPGPSTR